MPTQRHVLFQQTLRMFTATAVLVIGFAVGTSAQGQGSEAVTVVSATLGTGSLTMKIPQTGRSDKAVLLTVHMRGVHTHAKCKLGKLSGRWENIGGDVVAAPNGVGGPSDWNFDWEVPTISGRGFYFSVSSTAQPTAAMYVITVPPGTCKGSEVYATLRLRVER